MRLHACGQGLEVITAFQATDQASLSVLICNRHQLRGHPRVIGLNQTHLTEVIESMVKPSQPWGKIAQTAFGEKSPALDRGDISHTILAIGHQDTDPDGLFPPGGIEILGASSDHLILESERFELTVGAEVIFQLNYGAVVRAMTSPFVTKVMEPVLI